MMRKLLRWMTALLPLPVLLAGLICYGVVEGLYILVLLIDPTEPESEASRRSRWALVLGFVVMYAIFRTTNFNPFWNNRYLQWLKLTPWRWHLPLPLGPLHLVLQDLVLVLLTILMCHGSPNSYLMMLPICFLIVYLLPFCPQLYALEMPVSALLLNAGLGLMVLLCSISKAAAIGIGILLYVFLYLRFPVMFRSYPWGDVKKLKHDTFHLTQNKLGWPADVLAPATHRLLPMWQSLTWPFLVAWWVIAVIAITPEEIKEIWTLSVLMVPMIVFISSMLLGITHRPPISLLGRIFRFRWIIPGYDVVFLPTVIMVMFSSTVGVPLVALTPPIVAAPIIIGVGGLVLSISLRWRVQWQLTAPVRLVPGGYQPREFEHL